MHRFLLIACFSAATAGCVSQADYLAHDRASCVAIGFTPDTPEFRDCVLRFQTARVQGFYSSYYNGPAYGW